MQSVKRFQPGDLTLTVHPAEIRALYSKVRTGFASKGKGGREATKLR